MRRSELTLRIKFMGQVISIFRAAMARSESGADSSKTGEAPLFDSTPTGLDQAVEEGYYVEPVGEGPQVPEEC